MSECQCGERRCPATFRHVLQWTAAAVGVQCKHAEGHEGDHAGYAGFGHGDVFWPQEKGADAPS